MNLRLTSSAFGIALLTLSSARGAIDNDPPAVQPPGMEILARGPIHEGFAQPLNAQPQPGPIAPKQPPELIEEIAPDQKPAGDNVQWISGYWSWDEDQSNYIWVSGLWREPPPGRRWLAGHWQPINQGRQWVAGFWIPEATQEVQYLPAPPADIDQGPSSPAPDQNSTYIAGCWTHHENRYYWRPGYWVGNQPNWVWNSAHYVWTPSGYLYNDGYWDHPLDQRGLLFAPVRFGSAWGNQRYVPQYVVNSDFLLGALFVRTAAQHYYFGDYFEDRYTARGFTAWPDYRYGRGGYDSNYNYYRYQNAANPRWDIGVRDLYRARFNGGVPRPPQTLVQQVQAANTYTVNKTENGFVRQDVNLTNMQSVAALTALPQVNNTRVTNLTGLQAGNDKAQSERVRRLEAVTQVEHDRQLQAAAQMRESADRRRESEGNMRTSGGIPVKFTDPPKRVNLADPKTQTPGTTPPATPKSTTPPTQPQPPGGSPKQTPPAAQPQPQPQPPSGAPKQSPPAAPKQAPAPAPKASPPPAGKQAPTPPAKESPPATPKQAPPPSRKQPPPAPVIPKQEERPIPQKGSPSPEQPKKDKPQ